MQTNPRLHLANQIISFYQNLFNATAGEITSLEEHVEQDLTLSKHLRSPSVFCGARVA